MRAHTMTDDEAMRYLETPFNSSAYDSDAFSDEWWSVRDAVVSALEPLGIRDDYGGGDFCVGDSHNVSRGISVVLTSAVLLQPALITALSGPLRQAPCPYSVHVSTESSTFDLFVELERVLARCQPSLLHQLGLTAST